MIRKHGVGEVIMTEAEQSDALSKQAGATWDDRDEQALADEE